MRKRNCIFYILGLINFATAINADFFAFRKLTHPETGKMVYLLYDIHASIPIDPKVYGAKTLEIFRFVIENPTKWSFLSPWETNDEIKGMLRFLMNQFPNLNKQQEDLLNLVKTNPISLINEDWPPFNSDKERKNKRQINPLFMSKYAGVLNGDGNGHAYIENKTPMFEIGEKLTGTFSKNKFVQLDLGNYYYNPDARTLSSDCPTGAEACKLIDTLSLDAINTLFNSYDETRVIVAEGFFHTQAISNQLISSGYTPGPLIISSDLQIRRISNPPLDQFLTSFETHAEPEIANKLLDPSFYFDLIVKPIDLKAIFDAELQPDYKTVKTEPAASEPVSSKALMPKTTRDVSYLGVSNHDNLIKVESTLKQFEHTYAQMLNLDLEAKKALIQTEANLVKIEKVLQQAGHRYNQLVDWNITTKKSYL